MHVYAGHKYNWWLASWAWCLLAWGDIQNWTNLNFFVMPLTPQLILMAISGSVSVDISAYGWFMIHISRNSSHLASHAMPFEVDMEGLHTHYLQHLHGLNDKYTWCWQPAMHGKALCLCLHMTQPKSLKLCQYTYSARRCGKTSTDCIP